MVANKLMFAFLVVLHLGGCNRAPPLSTKPIHSSLGFSFVPPPGVDWTETFGKNMIGYDKKTDPAMVTFIAGALEIKLDAPLRDQAALLAFVRSKKDQWGGDGRFSAIDTSFLAEPGNANCVRYQMNVHDSGANIRKDLPFLIVQIAGRFCTHPVHPASAVDIFYTMRHVPTFDDAVFKVEGNAFLHSLRIDPVPVG